MELYSFYLRSSLGLRRSGFIDIKRRETPKRSEQGFVLATWRIKVGGPTRCICRAHCWSSGGPFVGCCPCWAEPGSGGAEPTDLKSVVCGLLGLLKLEWVFYGLWSNWSILGCQFWPLNAVLLLKYLCFNEFRGRNVLYIKISRVCIKNDGLKAKNQSKKALKDHIFIIMGMNTHIGESKCWGKEKKGEEGFSIIDFNCLISGT